MPYTVLAYISFLLALVVVNEGLVELVSKSGFFSFLRDFLTQSTNKVLKFFGDAISCPYCCSVWTAGFLSLLTLLFGHPPKVLNIVVDFMMLVVLVHRGSNLWHNITDKFFNKEYSINKE